MLNTPLMIPLNAQQPETPEVKEQVATLKEYMRTESIQKSAQY